MVAVVKHDNYNSLHVVQKVTKTKTRYSWQSLADKSIKNFLTVALITKLHLHTSIYIYNLHKVISE